MESFIVVFFMCSSPGIIEACIFVHYMDFMMTISRLNMERISWYIEYDEIAKSQSFDLS